MTTPPPAHIVVPAHTVPAPAPPPDDRPPSPPKVGWWHFSPWQLRDLSMRPRYGQYDGEVVKCTHPSHEPHRYFNGGGTAHFARKHGDVRDPHVYKLPLSVSQAARDMRRFQAYLHAPTVMTQVMNEHLQDAIHCTPNAVVDALTDQQYYLSQQRAARAPPVPDPVAVTDTKSPELESPRHIHGRPRSAKRKAGDSFGTPPPPLPSLPSSPLEPVDPYPFGAVPMTPAPAPSLAITTALGYGAVLASVSSESSDKSSPEDIRTV